MSLREASRQQHLNEPISSFRSFLLECSTISTGSQNGGAQARAFRQRQLKKPTSTYRPTFLEYLTLSAEEIREKAKRRCRECHECHHASAIACERNLVYAGDAASAVLHAPQSDQTVMVKSLVQRRRFRVGWLCRRRGCVSRILRVVAWGLVYGIGIL